MYAPACRLQACRRVLEGILEYMRTYLTEYMEWVYNFVLIMQHAYIYLPMSTKKSIWIVYEKEYNFERLCG